MLIKPAPGRLGLPDPRTMMRLPIDGRNVDLRGRDGAYWRRALRDGDVVDATPAPAPAEAPPAPEAAPPAVEAPAEAPAAVAQPEHVETSTEGERA